jgi:chromosome segregation ATPase
MTFTGDKLKTLEASLTDLTTKHTELDVKYLAMVETEKQLNAKVVELETAKTDLDAKLKAIEANPKLVDDLQAKVTALETEKAEAATKLEAATKVNGELDTLKKQFDAKVQEEASRLAAEIISAQKVPAPVSVGSERPENTNKAYVNGGLKVWSPFDKQ